MPYREDAARHRREAERCFRLAEQMTDDAMADQLYKIADTYEALARQIETLKLARPKDKLD